MDNPITDYFKNKDKGRKRRTMTPLQEKLYAFLGTDEGKNLTLSLWHANDETLAIELSRIVCADQCCKSKKIQSGHFLKDTEVCIRCGEHINYEQP